MVGLKVWLACDFVLDELNQDGWLVNQTRMWLASHWSVRNGKGWLHGQERMHQELIDGSRAANLLGWQWTVGSGNGKPYGFARWQVQEACATTLRLLRSEIRLPNREVSGRSRVVSGCHGPAYLALTQALK